MKIKHLLIAAVMILTALTAIAQNASDMRATSKDIVPYAKKLPPPPEFTNSRSKVSHHVNGSGPNAAFLSPLSDFDAKEIMKDPKRFKQQMLKKRNSLKLLSQRQDFSTPAVNNRNDQHSDFHLTKDINTLTHSYPSNNSDIHYHQAYAVLNDIIYFAADDGIHGDELWRSDGTEEGTYLVKDIVPGVEGSFPYTISAINDKLYFTAVTPQYGAEPWISDGTENGTQLLKDIIPGTADGFGGEFIGVGNTVYFAANSDPFFWSALWKTDGTPEGTVLVKDLATVGSGEDFISQLTNVNGLLFFTAFDYETSAWEVWRTDGTDEGTYHVGTGAVFTDFISQLTSYNNHLYFSASTDFVGRKLWISDGTDAGTIAAPGDHGVYLEAEYSFGATFPILNEVLYTTGVLSPDGSTFNNRELYKYDALNWQGLVKVKAIIAGNENGYTYPAESVIVNNTLYFIVVRSSGDTQQDELWESGGDKESTKPAQKFKPEENIYNLYNGYGRLYFVINNSILGNELWTVINTPLQSLAVPVSNVFKGAASSNPYDLTAARGKIFFSATDDKKGNELYATGGTIFSTSLVKDINTTTTAGSDAGRFPGTMRALGNIVLFQAYENATGSELYRSDGTGEGTYLLSDIVHGESGSDPGDFVSKKGLGYFNSFSTDNTIAMFKTDGEKGGLQKITPDYNDNDYGFLNYAVADNGLLFYTMYNRTADVYELWRSDGTAAGNFMLSSTLLLANALHILGSTALFVAGDGDNKELWQSDGTVAGTKLVKDINPGSGGSYPGGLFVYNNEVYFGAYDGVDHAFWKSDGTKKGTVEIKNIDPWWSDFPGGTARLFCISSGILYFSAIDYSGGNGTELWKTDGTSGGTQVVKDINPYDNSATESPYYLTDVNGVLFFTANDGVHGRELWKSDGTKKGTQMVKDIVSGTDPDPDFLVLTNLVSYAGKLYFTNNNSLWVSDGTKKGTTAVSDNVISKVSAYNVVAAGDQLFVSGLTNEYGTELYAGKIDNNTGMITMSGSANEARAKTTQSFDVILYPNPVSSNARLQITGNAKNVSITDLNGKQLWQSNNINASLINLPVEKFASGTYFVIVENGKETKTIKLVK